MEVWKIIFLFKWVICRFQPLIFQGVLKKTWKNTNQLPVQATPNARPIITICFLHPLRWTEAEICFVMALGGCCDICMYGLREELAMTCHDYHVQKYQMISKWSKWLDMNRWKGWDRTGLWCYTSFDDTSLKLTSPMSTLLICDAAQRPVSAKSVA